MEKAIVVRTMTKTMISIVVVIMANILMTTGAKVTIIPKAILTFMAMIIMLSINPGKHRKKKGKRKGLGLLLLYIRSDYSSKYSG